MEIKKGDKVKIVTKGIVLIGVATTAQDYGYTDDPNWHIEMTDADHGYVYWKQWIDGGDVEVLE